MVAASNELQPPVVLWDKRLIVIVGIGVILLAVDVWALFANVSGVIFALGAASTLVVLFLPEVITYRTVQFTLQATKSAPTIQPIRAYARANLRRSTFLMIVEAVLAIPLFVIFNLYLQLTVSAVYANIVTCTQCLTTPESSAAQQAIFALIAAIGLWGINPLACALGTGFALQSRQVVRALGMALVIVVILTLLSIYTLLSSQVIPILIAALLPYVLATIIKSLWKSVKKPLQ